MAKIPDLNMDDKDTNSKSDTKTDSKTDAKPFCDMAGKLRLDLVPPEVEESYAQVGEFGIKKLLANGVKNPENNWMKGLRLDADHITKARRHINEWRHGKDNDNESYLNPLKHALWHLGSAITQIERGRKDLDDRKFKRNSTVLSFIPDTHFETTECADCYKQLKLQKHVCYPQTKRGKAIGKYYIDEDGKYHHRNSGKLVRGKK